MRNITLITSTFLILTGTILAQPFPHRSIPRTHTRHIVGESAPDRLVIQHRAGADVDEIQRVLGVHGAAVDRHHSALRISVINVDPERRDEIMQELEESGLFNFVEPDYLAEVVNTPNDPFYSSQWHLLTIQAPSAWNLSTGSTSVPIAMVDSGVDPTHPDLASKLLQGWSFLTGTSDTHDVQGHGTTTAGAAAALGNNGIGVAGVAWQNPILPLVVADSTGYASYSNIASAITYAADHGARVVNVSIAGASASSTLQSAVSYAWNRGTVVFAAAGNTGSSAPNYPAACQYAVAVGATDSNDTLASFSSYGSAISLTAPGVNIYTTTNGGGYGYASGTSYSSPIAAGVAALVLSYAPSLSAANLVRVLETNADDLGAVGYDQYFGWGRVNAYRALVGSGTTVDTTPPTVAISSPGASASVQGTIYVQGTATDNVGVTRVEFYLDSNLVTTAYSSSFSFSWNTSVAANGSHSLVVKAYDLAGNVGQASVTVSVNNPISVSIQTLSTWIQSPSNGVTISGPTSVAAAASDSVSITQVCIYVDGVLYYTGSAAPYSFRLNTKKMASGAHSVFSRAWDALGTVATSAPITVYLR